jgi:YegS/Rv2252/BmrU family lipid kinase
MNARRTIDVIINPIAGIRPKAEVPEYVRSVLNDEEFDVRIYFTEYAGHASVLAAQSAAMGVDTVVAIGGDGTINETARSLVGTQTAFGIVPMGSGNGLARHIQIPLEVPRALEVVKEGHTDLIDYGVINGHIFFCTAGVGFDARVSQKFAEAKKRGGLTYVRSIFDLISKYKPSTYTIYTDDGRIREKAFLIAIGNAAQYGNNAYITPRASMQDGLMDVTLVKPFNIIDAPQMAVQLFTRNLDTNDNILTFRSSHLRIIMPQPDVVHVDGEPLRAEGVLDVQTHPGGLKVLTPATPTHNLLEPIQYAVEEIHYSILNNVRGMVGDVKKKLAEIHPAEPK